MRTVVENAVCPGCGCLCDDILLEIEDAREASRRSALASSPRVSRARRACVNGRAFFAGYDPSPRSPLVMGAEAAWDAAIAEAARILLAARSPLIFGLSSTASEAQRKAVELAEQLRASIDTTSSVCHGPTSLAIQAVGLPGCTLGEVRNRADLVIFWGCNPAVSHPRHFDRYSLPRGKRTSRTCVVVDVRPTPTAQMADTFLQIQPGSDYEILATMRALAQGKEVAAKEVGGVSLAHWQQLVGQMKSCRFGVLFFGLGLATSPGRDLNVSELAALVTELNQRTRFSALPMRGHGNVAGADELLTWQTGYPFAVNFATGFPRYGPGEFSAVDMLANGEVDAVLVVASDPLLHFPDGAARHLRAIPVVVLDPRPSQTAQVARVFLPTACYGLDAAGTFYRMDGVPIRLRAVLPPQRPSDEQVLDQMLKAVRAC